MLGEETAVSTASSSWGKYDFRLKVDIEASESIMWSLIDIVRMWELSFDTKVVGRYKRRKIFWYLYISMDG